VQHKLIKEKQGGLSKQNESMLNGKKYICWLHSYNACPEKIILFALLLEDRASGIDNLCKIC
jgi:hypothetical protein